MRCPNWRKHAKEMMKQAEPDTDALDYRTIKSENFLDARIRTCQCVYCELTWKTEEKYNNRVMSYVLRTDKTDPNYNKRWRVFPSSKEVLIETYEYMDGQEVAQATTLDLFSEVL